MYILLNKKGDNNILITFLCQSLIAFVSYMYR